MKKCIMNFEDGLLAKSSCLDELLTIDEIASKLKVKKSFLYAPARRKVPDPVPVVRVGKYLRYRLKDVMAWIERHKEKQS